MSTLFYQPSATATGTDETLFVYSGVLSAASSTIPAGARSVAFQNTHATVACTVNGLSYTPGAQGGFDAGSSTSRLPVITISATGSALSYNVVSEIALVIV